MHQLPCVLSLVLTGHKTQGLTTGSNILACLAPKDKSGASGWLYVILSRIKTIKGLFLMENIEKKIRPNASQDITFSVKCNVYEPSVVIPSNVFDSSNPSAILDAALSIAIKLTNFTLLYISHPLF